MAAAAKANSAQAATVSELLVTASVKCLPPDRSNDHADRPKVIDSYPAKGAVVRPGIVVVRVTFNRPMACDGAFAPHMSMENPCPGESREMLLSYDRRTFRTVCTVKPNTAYGMVLSQDPTAHSFMGLAGLPSLPYRLTFTTSAEAPVATPAPRPGQSRLLENRRRGCALGRARALAKTCNGPASPGRRMCLEHSLVGLRP
jgi:hypothetical protein